MYLFIVGEMGVGFWLSNVKLLLDALDLGVNGRSDFFAKKKKFQPINTYLDQDKS